MIWFFAGIITTIQQITLQIVVFTTVITTTATAATTTGFGGDSSSNCHNIKAYAKVQFRLHFFQTSVIDAVYFQYPATLCPRRVAPLAIF